jgi:MFS family permease
LTPTPPSRSRPTLFGLPRAVWLLGWVSLATDAASEAIYPLIPYFLTHVIAAGAVSIGIIEGAAEAANSVLKILAGRAADRAPAKRPLVLCGYALSSSVRPLIAAATSWPQVFAVRVADRVGKGIRGAPRDAMLAQWATRSTRGKVYGFHRAMDHLGAVIGPALATLFLVLYPDRYRTLFALTVVPGAIAVALVLFVPERSAPAAIPGARGADAAAPPRPRSDVEAARLPRRFYGFMAVLALFMLGNSTDAFLLLRLTEAAGGARYLPLIWAAHHIVKASVSVVGGSWSDRVGRRTVIALGWLIYAVVYGGFAFSASLPALLAWFMVYGVYFGLAEGTEKALVADLAPAWRRGLAFGWYNAVTGIGALAASLVFGILWEAFGARVAFSVGAAAALAATGALFLVIPRTPSVQAQAAPPSLPAAEPP